MLFEKNVLLEYNNKIVYTDQNCCFSKLCSKLLLFAKVKMEQIESTPNILYTQFENRGYEASHDYTSIKGKDGTLPKTLSTSAGLPIHSFGFTIALLLFSNSFKSQQQQVSKSTSMRITPVRCFSCEKYFVLH